MSQNKQPSQKVLKSLYASAVKGKKKIADPTEKNGRTHLSMKIRMAMCEKKQEIRPNCILTPSNLYCLEKTQCVRFPWGSERDKHLNKNRLVESDPLSVGAGHLSQGRALCLGNDFRSFSEAE